ncbi:MAG: VOC family protein [Pseudomonadota bacterium]
MPTIRAMPVLEVADVPRSAAFYEQLGFASHGYGDPPFFCIMQRGDVTIGLAGGTGPVRANNGWAAYVYVADAAALREEFVGAGIGTPTEIGDRPYGLRDFDIIDPDGHRIAFGSDIYPSKIGPGLGADRGRG